MLLLLLLLLLFMKLIMMIDVVSIVDVGDGAGHGLGEAFEVFEEVGVDMRCFRVENVG